MMNYEEQILELKKRIEYLEKEENKRKNKKKMKLLFSIIKYSIILIILFSVYFNYIKPIKEKIDYVEDKITDVEDFVGDKLDIFNNFNPFA